MSKQTLREALSQHEVVITFTKKDGSERVMRGTTNLDLINYTFKTNQKSGSTEKKKPEGQISVWDLDIKQWRTVIESKVTGWELSA